MKDWIKEAIAHWREEGVELNLPASIAEIERAEKVLDFIFPKDFRELYLTVNGFQNWDMLTNYFSFWPLERILEEYEKATNKSFIGFSDYLIRCHDIGFMRNETGIFKDFLDNVDKRFKGPGEVISVRNFDGTFKDYFNITTKIANSFQEIVLMINTDTGEIY